MVQTNDLPLAPVVPVPSKTTEYLVGQVTLKGKLYQVPRYKHYLAQSSGFRIYSTTQSLQDPKCVITGFSIGSDGSSHNVICPRPPGMEEGEDGEYRIIECPDGYVQVCVPNSHPPDCWCEWEGLTDP